jgi:hypothetical protein
MFSPNENEETGNNELTREIYNIVSEFMNREPNNTTPFSSGSSTRYTNPTNNRNNADNSRNRTRQSPVSQDDVLAFLRDYLQIMHEYNENIASFNEIIRFAMNSSSTSSGTVPPNTSFVPPFNVNTNTNTMNTTTSPNVPIIPRNSTMERNRRIRQNLDILDLYVQQINRNTQTAPSESIEPITREQIDNATQIIQYNSTEMEDEMCPITMENFTIDEDIIRVIECGHIFKPQGFYTWLRRNTCCPVCRYDLRNYHSEPRAEENIQENLSENTETVLPAYVVEIEMLDLSSNIISRRISTSNPQLFSFDLSFNQQTNFRDYIQEHLAEIITSLI